MLVTTSESHSTLSKYRADIDGLRAIAVLLVVFNHLQFPHFGGGYVGVDVFFVISGHLIGTSLITEFSRGSFTLIGFYERRIRRIFPALLAMLSIVTVLAYRFLMPEALVAYAGSLGAAALSFSNFFFWRQAGYFDALSIGKPLLHTWSLAVEEQFYVFFPLLLFCVFRWGRQQLRVVLWAAAAITFALAVWVTGLDASTAFFWSPLRAWELLAGVLISQQSWKWLASRSMREAATVAGLLLIVVPGMHYTSETPFPGWTALFPCLGTVLIIAAGGQGGSAVASLLSTGPFRFLGLISYSLYLWHWPILVFQNTGLLISNRPFGLRSTRLEILGVSLLVATLSWWLVETPFRKGRLKLQRRPLFLLTGGVTALLVCVCAATIYAKGAPSRFSNEVIRMASFEQYDTSKAWQTGSCFLMPYNTFRDFKPEQCLQSLPGHKEYLLYGDSTAAQLYPGLSKVFPELHFQQATAASCPPKEDQAELKPRYRANCRALWTYMHHVYLPTHHPDAVILASTWSSANPASLQAEIQDFQSAGIPVVLLGPVIDFDLPLPQLLSREMQQPGAWQKRASRFAMFSSQANLVNDGEMARLAHDRWKVRYISYFKILCNHQVEMLAQSQLESTTGCPLVTEQGEPLMFDTHHLTISGSILFATTVRRLGLLP